MACRLFAMAVVLVIPGHGAAGRQPPPPQFSKTYVEALKGVLDLEDSDVRALDRRLATRPDDFAARLKLMAYTMRGDVVDRPEMRARRVELALWLIEHQPDSEILGSPYAVFGPGDLDADQLNRAEGSWLAAVRAHSSNASVYWNAANFHRRLDPAMYRVYLERSVALNSSVEYRNRELGLLYAQAILSGRDAELAGHATLVLDSTANAQLLEPAVKLFRDTYNSALISGRDDPRANALAQKYFARAKALDPGLDEALIYPKLDPKMIGMMAPGAAAARMSQAPLAARATGIRRIPPSAVPGLPPEIIATLSARGCRIPQQSPRGRPENAVRGEFFAKGTPSWAVLCSVRGWSTVLVFRVPEDKHPATLAREKDEVWDVGFGTLTYPRGIRAANRPYIMEHYRAYGGPKPPPIDHQGIEDGTEKGSTIYYHYRGRWFQLTGAD